MTDAGARPPTAEGLTPLPDGALSSLDRVLGEDVFRETLAVEVAPLLAVSAALGAERTAATPVLARLVADAERLDGRLRTVGARGNRMYAFVAEVVPLVRALASVQHALLHLRARWVRTDPGEPSALGDLDAALAFVRDRLLALLSALRAEVEGPIGGAPDVEGASAPVATADERWRLPQDLDVPAGKNARDRIAEMATAFLAMGDELGLLALPDDLDSPVGRAALTSLARDTFSASEAERARGAMHAVQSAYDSVVAGTAYEDVASMAFRVEVSVLLHALEAVSHGLVAHRHLVEDVRSSALRERLGALVDPDMLLRWVFGSGLRFAQRRAQAARPRAAALLEAATRVAEVALALPPGRKLHLRPAGLIVRVVQHHGLPVEMGMGAQSVDARHLMDVILLAAGNPTETEVRFRGDERPLADLAVLFHHRLGEEGHGSGESGEGGTAGFPPALSYLRDPRDLRKPS